MYVNVAVYFPVPAVEKENEIAAIRKDGNVGSRSYASSTGLRLGVTIPFRMKLTRLPVFHALVLYAELVNVFRCVHFSTTTFFQRFECANVEKQKDTPITGVTS